MQDRSLSELREDLLALLKRDAFKKGTFVLSSGKTSSYYLDGRIITMTPEGAWLVASIMLKMIEGAPIQAFGGPTIGADPIVGAVACLSHIQGRPVKTFIVRKQAKEHGTQRQVEGPALSAGDTVILVDDVATTGKALIEAHQALSALGVKVRKAIVIVDRDEGAGANLARIGVVLESIFTLEDLGV
jgi:orotate phosphoribosyltransferase